MPVRPIHGRENLLKLIQGKSIYDACNRCIARRNIEVLGGFNPPYTRPYWCVQVWGEYGAKVWYLYISPSEDGTRYEFTTDMVAPDWAYWDGEQLDTSSLQNGDVPMRYGALKIEALEQLKTQRKIQDNMDIEL